jgi:hypothetical protein
MWVSTYPPITLYIHKTKHLIEWLHNSLLYIGERETRESEIEKMDHEHKDSTSTWADRKQEKKWEREREREERPLFMNSNVKRPYRTVLRKDLCREDEETLQMGSSIAEPKGRW